MCEFREGDVVRVNKEYSPNNDLVNKIGIIRANLNGHYGVEFDDAYKGCHFLNARLESPTGYYIHKKYLTLEDSLAYFEKIIEI